MLLEAIYHRPKQNWAYAYDNQTIHLRIRTKRRDVERAEVVYGDKYLPWDQMCTKEMSVVGHDELFDYWHVEVEPPYRRLSYGFKLHAGEETIWLTERTLGKEAPNQHLGNFEFPFLNPADVFTPPAWVKDAVFYQIFPERFANGDPANDPEGVEPWGGKPTPSNFFGGDLQGVINHLDYIEKLGVNAIYFTPVFEATTNHKYDTQDYMKVDPHFGTNDTLKELVKACHARGIRVLLDAVFNHSGRTFAPFVDVMEKGADSPYADWFYVREYPLRVVDGVPTYETFAFEPKMPKLNTENPAVKAYLLDVARYWIEEVGIDGWRLDVANEVDHQFWREFRKVVKSVNPEAYILGELFHEGMMWLQGDQFDALMNYPFTGAVLDFFVNGKNDGAQFAGKMYGQLFRYPHQANEVTFNLLDSHDTERLLTLCKGDVQKMKLAALFQLTFLGAPCIYYGDEIGLSGSHDPDCRKCMPWDDSEYDLDLLGFYQRTIALRHRYSALRTGSFKFLYAKEDDTRIAYERQDDESHFMIMMNVKKKERVIQLALPAGEWVDEIGDARILSTGKKMKFSLPAFGALVLRKLES
ncbi:alpha-glycosidase [Paenibacillus selenitireducens]|uniref:Alpha-glycosidase n=1 Tax=Paenibacillus selenitireducens TaxID=1324314 RepID=A0A1T2X8Z0_9BACL|nr:alpha-glycosidase [Paenibacillus selenitireducens]OPA76063.1 alpha-glycosidase [Paenibacillus selenitireducens]